VPPIAISNGHVVDLKCRVALHRKL
jgi:hypothetical protein